MPIDETKYRTLFITKFKVRATQYDSEFNRILKENGSTLDIKLDFYKSAFEILIKQLRKEIAKDEYYEFIITTQYELFINTLKGDKIDTTKYEKELLDFKKYELPKLKITRPVSKPTIEPEYRNYNLNTKYGRRKAREQALRNYENGTPEYRQDIDNIKAVFWIAILIIIIIYFVIKYS
jgi:hypothetical protein